MKIRVFVDELRVWPNAKGIFKKGSCHLMANGESSQHMEALHEFAKKIGMKREWFQDHPRHPHYDLTPSRRDKALKLGAIFVDSYTQAKERMERQKKGQR